MGHFPPRVHVLLASHAPLGVVIRRGPSRRACTLLWNRDDDTFETGQWLKGHIYEHRSDLSPDGRHLIYLAVDYRKHRWQTEVGPSWTAISRAPYLKAITLYRSAGTWGGGGLFAGPTTYWLNDPDEALERCNGDVQCERADSPLGPEDPIHTRVYYHRLQRDGWHRMGEQSLALYKPRDPFRRHAGVTAFERPIGHGWVLRKLVHDKYEAKRPLGGGSCYEEHELVHAATDHCERLPEWRWAELDRDRVVWAVHGQLWAGKIGPDGIEDPTLLKDFSGMAFQPIAAPY